MSPGVYERVIPGVITWFDEKRVLHEKYSLYSDNQIIRAVEDDLSERLSSIPASTAVLCFN